MEKTKLQELITGYLAGTLSAEQLQQLQAYMAVEEVDGPVTDILEALIAETEPKENYNTANLRTIQKSILATDKSVSGTDRKVPVTHRIHFLKTKWFQYAAAVVLFFNVAVITFFSLNKQKQQSTQATVKTPVQDIPPGGNKAVLRLANGSVIVLDTAINGKLALQGNVRVIKLQNGQLQFKITESNSTNSGAELALNTITTPKGGQYQVALPDGTQVWLNAASSLTFPTAFTSKSRSVQITGEAYFEVAKDATKPFQVEANGTTIEVLGTHFNTNAYPNESNITTTLLEGKVLVKTATESTTLLPGQQAKSSGRNISTTENSDTEEAVAWKNGRFQFKGADIKTVLRQIERWYEVDVVYESEVQMIHLSGEVPRSFTLQQVMKVLQESGVNLRLQDRKLYVNTAQ